MNNGAFDVQLRNFSGFLSLQNCNQSTTDFRTFFNSGGISLESTVSGGNFVFTGVGNIIDNSTGGKIDSSGLVQGEIIG